MIGLVGGGVFFKEDGMLVLTREEGQKLVLIAEEDLKAGQQITVEVCQFHAYDGRICKRVRLGVEAPRSMKVLRGELLDPKYLARREERRAKVVGDVAS